MNNTLKKAKEFMYRNARPLDLARFQYHFENGSKESVVNALSYYQNEDGGFGHAVEADCWNPNSIPLHSNTASDIIREIDFEDDACQAFIDTINKLYTNRATLIAPLIERMELLHSKVNGTEIRLRTIDKEIAELSRQSLVISELMKKGILESSDFYSQYNELSARISELRIKRRECLNENDTDEVIKSLRQLDDMLEDMESELTDYDEDIIRAIIRDATVISNTELRINLRCGLTVTEHLPQYYSRRCKQ